MDARRQTSPQHEPCGQEQQGPVSRREICRNRPQIYVHLEIGVAWTPSHPHRSRAHTFMSRGVRDQQNLTHHAQPMAANYLVPEPPPDHRHRSGRHRQQHHSNRIQPQERTGHDHSNSRRQGRQHERSSQHHERGSSAPPPVSDSPWDFDGGPGPARPSEGNNRRFPNVEAPWAGGSDAEGFGEYHPDHDLTISRTLTPYPRRRRGGRERREGSSDELVPFVNNPTIIPIDSRTVPSHTATRGEDPDRVRELEALGSAMMTVDNGFEDQWWNQGDRENVQQQQQHNHSLSTDGYSNPNRNSFLSDSGVVYNNNTYETPAPPMGMPGDSIGGNRSGVSGHDNNRRISSGVWAEEWEGAIPTTAHEVSPDGYYRSEEGQSLSSYRGEGGGDERPNGGPVAVPALDRPYLGARMSDESLVVSPMTDAATPQLYTSLNRTLTTRSEELHF